jgi:hypothetical protein
MQFLITFALLTAARARATAHADLIDLLGSDDAAAVWRIASVGAALRP